MRIGRWRNVVLAGIMPLVLNAVVWPLVMSQAPPVVVLADPRQAMWYVIPLVGVVFLVWWVKMVVRTARWGPLYFQLSGDPPRPGGRVKGWVVTGAGSLPGGAHGAAPECTVTLRCVARRDRVGKSSKEVQRVLAEVSETVAMEQVVTAAGRQVRVPVDFGLPENAATSTAANERGERIWWEVEARGRAVRPRLHAEIRIPVVHLASAAEADGAGVTAGGFESPGGADAHHLITTEARELYSELEQRRSEADGRGVFARLLRPRRQAEHHAATPGGEPVVVQLRGDGGVRRLWSLIFLVLGVAAVAFGVILAVPVVLVVALIVRGALRPVMVRLAVQPDHLVCDRLRGRKVRRREWAWPDISTCQTMVGVQFLTLGGLVTRWDLMIQAGMRSGMAGLRMEDDGMANTLAGVINSRAGG